MLYKFKVKKSLNLLEMNNLNINDLATPPDMSIISFTKRSENSAIIIKASIKRAVAIRVPLKSFVTTTTFFVESYRP